MSWKKGSILGLDEEDDPVLVETYSEVRVKESSSKNLKDFRQLDMVNDCSDHHFVDKSSISGEKKLAKESSGRMEHFGQRSSWCEVVAFSYILYMITYEVESPDEAAFVIAARELGFKFYKRTHTFVSFMELDPVSKKRVERLAKNGREFEESTKEHVNEYVDACLRTLILAYRELTEEEYKEFNEKFKEAKNSVSVDRDELIDQVTACRSRGPRSSATEDRRHR
ncbi:hypothetical protein L1987_60207 [Smallanthus sonchifolius]|uniref:Uncharacterized protein n=1 Tax=Smallanthus sonchifolius TaxID=185202 RepID=A0ACB9D7D1_9ASTR|nr:hypothetical protein L1987_60207 [Smallanthus sonchifolius]